MDGNDKTKLFFPSICVVVECLLYVIVKATAIDVNTRTSLLLKPSCALPSMATADEKTGIMATGKSGDTAHVTATEKNNFDLFRRSVSMVMIIFLTRQFSCMTARGLPLPLSQTRSWSLWPARQLGAPSSARAPYLSHGALPQPGAPTSAGRYLTSA